MPGVTDIAKRRGNKWELDLESLRFEGHSNSFHCDIIYVGCSWNF